MHIDFQAISRQHLNLEILIQLERNYFIIAYKYKDVIFNIFHGKNHKKLPVFKIKMLGEAT